MNLSVKNFLMVGMVAVLFIILLKVIVNKYPMFKTLEPIANAI